MAQKTAHYLSILLVILLVVMALAACGGDDDEGQDAQDTIQTSVQFSWVHTIEFAGFYAAEDQGLYADNGLEVRLDEGGFNDAGEYIDPIQKVVNGEADFGIASPDQVLLARAAGQPVVAVASVYQRSPVAIFALAESGIVKPQDLVGKKIGTEPGTVTFLVYRALLTSQGIDPDDLTEVPQFDEHSMQPLIEGELDARTGFVTNEVVSLRSEGYDINVIMPSDYGIEMGGNMIVVNEDTLENRPDLVEAFVRATIQGYEEAVGDVEHAAQLSTARNETLSQAAEEASMRASVPLIQPAGTGVGAISPETWVTAQDILLEQGLLDEPLELEAAYTLAIVNAIHAE